jgi:hypothetical protein
MKKVRQKYGKSSTKMADLARCMGYSMDTQPKPLFGTLQFDKRCEARTRSGGRCRNAPLQLSGRCRMHGGASLRGEAHPRYKHGKYSKYRPLSIDELIARYAGMTVELEPFALHLESFDIELEPADLDIVFADLVL